VEEEVAIPTPINFDDMDCAGVPKPLEVGVGVPKPLDFGEVAVA
jgi:hypothetical protein